MSAKPPTRGTVRFGVFEVDLDAGELHCNGSKVKLQDQPHQVLAALLERPGKVVTREEICERLWPDGTFVEFDRSLNIAVNKLRDALGDSAGNPRFVETVPRRGYRFIAPVEGAGSRRRTGPVVGAALAVAALAVAGFWVVSDRAPSRRTPSSPVPLTSYPGEECHPSFAPDGNQIAFCWNGPNQDNFDIYIKLVGPGEPINLTNHPAAEGYPQWSPDGMSIAFLRQVGPGRVGVFVIPALGGRPANLIAEIAGSVSVMPHAKRRILAWSPDSKWLMAGDEMPAAENARTLTLLSVATGEKVLFATLPDPWTVFKGASFSPDGHRLAVLRGAEFAHQSDLHVLQLDERFRAAGEPLQVTNGFVITASPVWNEDGSEILFLANEGASGWRGTSSLWRVRSDGAEDPERVDAAKQNMSFPAVSWRRRRLVYAQGPMDTNIWRLDLLTSAVEKIEWMSSTRLDNFLELSPDGNRVAVQSGRSGVDEIWLFDRRDHRARQLTKFGKAITGSPSWSPDGSMVAYDSSGGEDPEFDIYTQNVDGSAPQRLTHHPSADVRPCWSRDGKWIYFSSNRTGRAEVWKTLAGGGEPLRVTTNGGSDPGVSLDGKYIYFTRSAAGDPVKDLFRIPAEGGEEEKVLDAVWRSCYALSTEGIYFVRSVPAQRLYTIGFFDSQTSATRVLAESRSPIPFGLTVSPGGNEVLFSRLDQQEYDLMLVESFE